MSASTEAVQRARQAFDRRQAPGTALAAQSGPLVAACHDMARRFHAGATLMVFGSGGAAADAHHVAVEFMHPVIVGKRALPALALSADVSTLTAVTVAQGPERVFAAGVELLGSPGDIALGITPAGADPAVRAGLVAARGRGMLTVVLTGAATGETFAADHTVTADTDDPRLAKEAHVTAYHILWEMVHVCFENPELLATPVTS